jgi:hypothetical protein
MNQLRDVEAQVLRESIAWLRSEGSFLSAGGSRELMEAGIAKVEESLGQNGLPDDGLSTAVGIAGAAGIPGWHMFEEKYGARVNPGLAALFKPAEGGPPLTVTSQYGDIRQLSRKIARIFFHPVLDEALGWFEGNKGDTIDPLVRHLIQTQNFHETMDPAHELKDPRHNTDLCISNGYIL